MPEARVIIANIFLFCNISFAICAKDIVPIHISSDEISNLCAKITENIEPFASDWSKSWNFPVSKKAVEDEIKDALNLLNSRVWADDLWTLDFLQALLWHYYYQLENEEGFVECEKITAKLAKDFPNKIETLWLRGINKVKAGRVAEGFAILDELYINSGVPSAFVSEYSRLSKMCFIPKNKERNTFSQYRNNDRYYFSPKELKPLVSQWESNETNGVVGFVFTEQYRFVENFKLPYPKLYTDNEQKLSLEIDSLFMKVVKDSVLWKPERAALHPVSYRITIDRSPQKMTLFEYMYSIVHNRFDFVEEIKPPLKAGGISARSGQYNVIRGVSGKSVTYTVFDIKTDGNAEQFFTTKNTMKGVRNFNIRVLAALETTQKIENKALDFYLDIINGNFRIH